MADWIFMAVPSVHHADNVREEAHICGKEFRRRFTTSTITYL
jgi:hypothetical protein